MACTTTSKELQRPLPTKIETCATVAERTHYRDERMEALRGSAVLETKDHSLDLELAVVWPGLSRVEITGALGIRLGMLVWNEDWLQVFLPRDNVVYRIPAVEMEKNSPRRARFLEQVPFPLFPEAYFDSLLTRVGVRSRFEKDLECRFVEEERAYRARFTTRQGGRMVWIDPTSFAPQRVLYFDKQQKLPELHAPVESMRPVLEARYSDFQGEGLATLPAQLVLFSAGQKQLSFFWKTAEVWNTIRKESFKWQPGASISVKEF